MKDNGHHFGSERTDKCVKQYRIYSKYLFLHTSVISDSSAVLLRLDQLFTNIQQYHERSYTGRPAGARVQRSITSVM